MKFSAVSTLISLAALTVCVPAFAKSGPDVGPTSTAHQDTKFLEKANQGCVDEVALAQIALKKSTNDDVKNFAQKMIHDHTQLMEDMKPFDFQAGVQPPAHPDAATEAEKLKLDLLSGQTFDKAYIKAMVEDHHKDLQEFAAEEKSTAYPAFKKAVAHGEEVVRQHLELIDQLAKKNGVTPAPIPSGI